MTLTMILAPEQMHAIFAIDFIRPWYQPMQSLQVRHGQIIEVTSVDWNIFMHKVYLHNVRSYLRPEAFLEI